MTICHGQGDPANDGCCYVAGLPCPLRVKVVNGRVLNNAGSDLGTVDTFANGLSSVKAGRDRAKAQLQGVRIACRAALEVIAADSRLVTDRAALNAAWNAHAGYVQLVRPHWTKVEAAMGLPPGSYNCSTWKGDARPTCCFAESPAVNDAKAAALTTSALTIRRAGGT